MSIVCWMTFDWSHNYNVAPPPPPDPNWQPASPPPPRDGRLLPAALEWASAALANPGCASLFPKFDGWSADQVLQNIAKSGSFGQISFADMSPWAAWTSIRSDGRVGLVINNTTSDEFIDWNDGDRLNNATLLLHELAHALWVLNGKSDPGSFNQHDSRDAPAANADNLRIEFSCLKDKLEGVVP